MYLGHAGVALVLKARAPDVPMVPLVLACYGPDWIDALLMIPRPREGMAMYSHSLPALAVGAALAGAGYALIMRRRGAMTLVLGWLLHWPADLLTGVKPVITNRQFMGLDLYHMAYADAILESAVIIIACVLYARALAPERRRRAVVVTLAIALVVMQMSFDVVLHRLDTLPWSPQLAFGE